MGLVGGVISSGSGNAPPPPDDNIAVNNGLNHPLDKK